MSQLTEFYTADGLDAEGRTFGDIMALSLHEMESTCDFVQWLFPLPEPSDFYPEAPLLTKEDQRTIASGTLSSQRLFDALDKFLYYCGIQKTLAGPIEKADNFDKRKHILFSGFNHNHRRMTRVLACLTIFGWWVIAEQIVDFLEDNGGCPSSLTAEHWRNAVKDGSRLKK